MLMIRFVSFVEMMCGPKRLLEGDVSSGLLLIIGICIFPILARQLEKRTKSYVDVRDY